MQFVTRHVSKCFLAGIVAVLPVGGLVLMVVYVETTLAGAWLAKQPWYVPGLGLLAAACLIYGIGLTVTTFVGRWIWNRFDQVFNSLPALGRLYQTLKQIIGYGEGKDAMFLRVVSLKVGYADGDELGLVTNETTAADGRKKLVVFVPGAPNPTAGRLIVIDEAQTAPLAMSVSETLKTLISLGKTPISLAHAPATLPAPVPAPRPSKKRK
ncbi:MAG: DUF502 domain-containing protein [Planctomycetes bacterium]|nr:DUF502 domain-containing protein [Planctomycetota bacterium]